MKTKKFIPLILVLLFSISVFGQANSGDNAKQAYIEIKGTAEKEIIPDEIFISISIMERMDGKDKIGIVQQEEALKQGLINIGIPIENLKLAGALANYTQVRRSRKDVIAQKQYRLMVTNANTLGKVFDVLDELKIEDASIARVSHSKIEEYRKEVKILAIKIAKEKADYLLGAIGEQTGKPMVVKEVDFNRMASNQRSNVAYPEIEEQLYYDMGAYGSGIQFQHITLKSTMYVKFEIK